MSDDDDEITGVHSLPHPIQVVVVGIAERLKQHRERHSDLAKEVAEMRGTVTTLHNDNIESKAERRQLKWLIVLVPTTATFLHWLATHFIR